MDEQSITARQLLQLLQNDSILLVHIMSRNAFIEYRIKNSIWKPFNKIEDHDFSHLDRNKTIVTYCKNESCMSSVFAAGILRENGFKALAYRGGIQEWRSLGYPSESGET
ncbi:MAG: rhodanese-like domain-containing protein [Thermoplasmata archaeon]